MNPSATNVVLALSLLITPELFGQPQEDQQEQERDDQEEQEELPSFAETVVVTASRAESRLMDAPATMTVLDSEEIATAPAQSYGDLLRSVPGMNVIQTSARDINLTSRGATGTLATSQLALLDGRTLYQDYFGFVAWDFLPIDTHEIKQIEAIRGPASAVWGANAMSGVVNIITRTPRELEGTSVTLGVGGFGRSVEGSDEGLGALLTLGVTHAQVVSDRLAFKVSGGVFAQNGFARPTGTIPNDFMTPYPPYRNDGTTQPRFDARVDYDFGDGKGSLIASGGLAATGGVIHTGVGPFEFDQGTAMGYGKLAYRRGNLELAFFSNIVDGLATALLSRDPMGSPITYTIESQTYDVSLTNSRLVGTRQILTYGGNFRHSNFGLSFAPGGDHRTEGGAYLQDEIFINDHLRWVIGARVDKFDVVNDAVFSPRTTFLVQPNERHTLRASYNRAFRAPSLTNNFLDVQVASDLDLGLLDPRLAGQTLVIPVAARGNPDLKQESRDAYEIGYTALVGDRTTLSAAYYWNDTKDIILFTEAGEYTSANPPPGWPLPPAVLDLLVSNGAGLPSEFTYLNLGNVRDQGLELAVDTSIHPNVGLYGSYSWQKDPDVEDFDISELNLPPSHRFDVGVDVRVDDYFGKLHVLYTGDAFWQDVLDARFHGPTEAFTMVNLSCGKSWSMGRFVSAIKVMNLFDREIQQHVFGDIIKRQIVGELRFQL